MLLHATLEHAIGPAVIMCEVKVSCVGVAGFFQVLIDQFNVVLEIKIIFKNASLEEREVCCSKANHFLPVVGLLSAGFIDACLGQSCSNGIAGGVPACIGDEIVQGIIGLYEQGQDGFACLKMFAEIYDSGRDIVLLMGF